MGKHCPPYKITANLISLRRYERLRRKRRASQAEESAGLSECWPARPARSSVTGVLMSGAEPRTQGYPGVQPFRRSVGTWSRKRRRESVLSLDTLFCEAKSIRQQDELRWKTIARQRTKPVCYHRPASAAGCGLQARLERAIPERAAGRI